MNLMPEVENYSLDSFQTSEGEQTNDKNERKGCATAETMARFSSDARDLNRDRPSS